jgi:hypothetical protein
MAGFVETLKHSASEFSSDDCMSSGAAMAYYAIFSLPPLLILVAAIAGYFGVEPKRIQELAQNQLGVSTLDEETLKQQSQRGAAEGGWRLSPGGNSAQRHGSPYRRPRVTRKSPGGGLSRPAKRSTASSPSVRMPNIGPATAARCRR